MDKVELKRKALAEYLGIDESQLEWYQVHPYDKDCQLLRTDGFITPKGCYIVNDSIEEARYFHKCFIEDLIIDWRFFGALLNGIEDWAIDNCVNYDWIVDKICDYWDVSSLGELFEYDEDDEDYYYDVDGISLDSTSGELFRYYMNLMGGKKRLQESEAITDWESLQQAFDYDKISDYLIDYQGWWNLSSDAKLINLKGGFVAFWLEDDWFDSVILE